MERLTDKELVKKLKEHYYGDHGKTDEAYLRLAELEDKLESGRLVESPCKIGDSIFVIVSNCHRCENDGGDHCWCKNVDKKKIVEMRVNSIRYSKYGYVLTEDSSSSMGSLSLYCHEEDLNNKWFLDKEQAKIKLKELQGNKT